MNDYQNTMYSQLMALVEDGDTFFFQDFDLDGKTFRIFNYRLSSYSEFLKPSALECRGHMFEVNSSGEAIRLAALPVSKFFNLGENPFTLDLDLTKITRIEAKADGSLISTYTHDGKLRLKSKGSLFSEQAIDAMAWLDQPENTPLRELLEQAAFKGITVNLEWCSPTNRIVLGYLEPKLIVLNARDMLDGAYQPTRTFSDIGCHTELVDTLGLDLVGFVASIPTMQDDIEGFVILLESGQRVKIKTEKYLSLHHAKDSVNNPRRLFEAVVDEGIDDLRSMFSTDVLAMKLIAEMEERVSVLFNHMVAVVENFHSANKHLERKFYAIKGRIPAELDQLYFGLAMNLYLGKSVNYRDFAKSKYRELGFKDTQQDVK